MLTEKQLREIVSFSHCACPVSQPNFEKVRGHLKAVLDAYKELSEQSITYLNLLEFKKGKEGDFDACETAQGTIKARRLEINILSNGKSL